MRHEDQRILGVLSILALATLGVWSTGQWIAGSPGVAIDSPAWHDDVGPAPRFVIQVNQANWTEFAQLPGIGETLARRIVDFRETNGPYRTIDAIRRIQGIGPSAFTRIRPYLEI